MNHHNCVWLKCFTMLPTSSLRILKRHVFVGQNKINNSYCLIKDVFKHNWLPTRHLLWEHNNEYNDCCNSLVPLPWFMQRDQLFCSSLLLSHQCKCHQNGKKASGYYKNSFNLADSLKGLGKHTLRTAVLNCNNKRGFVQWCAKILFVFQEEDKHSCRKCRVKCAL